MEANTLFELDQMGVTFLSCTRFHLGWFIEMFEINELFLNSPRSLTQMHGGLFHLPFD